MREILKALLHGKLFDKLLRNVTIKETENYYNN